MLVPLILAAALLRLYDLGGPSLWYDEVVSMSIARAPGPRAMLDLLGRIDATRAPLHPLLLQGWLAVLGPSDAAGRGFSAICGVLTVVLVHRLGRRLFDDEAAAAWSAALAVASPLLVYYGREARMYAWLVLVTCLAWDALLGLKPGSPGRSAWYVLWLAALGYSHPLGLLMAATLAMSCLLRRRAQGLTWRGLLAPHLAAGLLLAPWLPRYLDHPPEYTVGRLPMKFLLGTPIGFVGGNFLTLAALAALIAWGSYRGARRGGRGSLATGTLLLWLVLPPVVLYAYAMAGHPIFGPNRYTLYVAPAFLLLLGRGIATLPAWPRRASGLATLALSVATLPGMVFAPGMKADWRGAAARLLRADPDSAEPLLVTSSESDPSRNLEVVTARYYIPPPRPIVPVSSDLDRLDEALPRPSGAAWVAIGLRDGRPAATWPGRLPASATIDVPGLRLVRAVRPPEEVDRP